MNSEEKIVIGVAAVLGAWFLFSNSASAAQQSGNYGGGQQGAGGNYGNGGPGQQQGNYGAVPVGSGDYSQGGTGTSYAPSSGGSYTAPSHPGGTSAPGAGTIPAGYVMGPGGYIIPTNYAGDGTSRPVTPPLIPPSPVTTPNPQPPPVSTYHHPIAPNPPPVVTPKPVTVSYAPTGGGDLPAPKPVSSSPSKPTTPTVQPKPVTVSYNPGGDMGGATLVSKLQNGTLKIPQIQASGATGSGGVIDPIGSIGYVHLPAAGGYKVSTLSQQQIAATPGQGTGGHVSLSAYRRRRR